MAFDFKPEKVDAKLYLNAELASAYFEALSIFLTYGEDLVIDTAGHHRQSLTDPVLKQVSVLIGQEAIYSRVHNEWNDVLATHRFPQPLKLSMMADIEHFTAVLAEYMMKHEDHFFVSNDEQQRCTLDVAYAGRV